MSVQVETLEKNMAKLTVEVPADQLEKALQNAYNKMKGRFNVPGFRKGKVPRNMIEKMYGPEIFFDDAANELITKTYSDAYDESGLDIVSRPEIDVVQIEKGKDFIYTALVAVKPEVTLGQYKGIEVEKRSDEVTAEEVEEKLKAEATKNAREVIVEDRPVADDDQIIFDFEGFVDGVPFEGGKGENYPLVIGSHSFIPGFEEQLIGVEKETPVDVTVTFPEDYHAEELKGKEAVFKCLVHEIKAKELPEIDDEFASEVSEFDTLDEYKADLEKQMKEQKAAANKGAKEDDVVKQAVENASYDIPDPMIEAEIDQLVNNFQAQMSQSGLNMEQYFQITGQTEEGMREEFKGQAVRRIETRIVLEAIAKAENIEISDEKVDEKIEEIAKAYNMEAEQVKGFMSDADKKQIREDLAVQEAITLIADSAVEK